MMRRVVVTGLGAISPCGNSAAETWDAMVYGRSGIDRIRSFDCEAFPVRIGGEVKDFDGVRLLGKRSAKRMDRFSQFAVVAADEALLDAGLNVPFEEPERVGVFVGTGIGGLGEILRGQKSLEEEGQRGVSPFLCRVYSPILPLGLWRCGLVLKGPIIVRLRLVLRALTLLGMPSAAYCGAIVMWLSLGEPKLRLRH
jgi:3-oxoacyl-(acyl-carrier-protein) synthase